MLALSAWVRPASVLLPCRGASAQLHRFPVAVSTRRVNVSAEKLEFRAQCHPGECWAAESACICVPAAAKSRFGAGLEEVVAQELMKAPVHARDVEYTAQKAGVDFRFVCLASSFMFRLQAMLQQHKSTLATKTFNIQFQFCSICYMIEVHVPSNPNVLVSCTRQVLETKQC